jgi:uncharacterized protein
MPVVSNTSPLWNLAAIDSLDLLRDQYPDIRIPTDVWRELQVGQGYPETARIRRAVDDEWVTIEAPAQTYLRQSLRLGLDQGEAAAIALALEIGESRILIDEADGRAAAKAMGLRPIGVLGVLLRAKEAGKLASVSDQMTRLRKDAGFFIAESLFQRVRQAAGE